MAHCSVPAGRTECDQPRHLWTAGRRFGSGQPYCRSLARRGSLPVARGEDPTPYTYFTALSGASLVAALITLNLRSWQPSEGDVIGSLGT
jgi:hypothetical protein